MLETSAAFEKLYEIVKRLRAPDGCPWDREQSPLSLRSDLIEETYECVEAIDNRDAPHIREELGDVFLLATMIAYMHEQEGSFSVADSLEEVSEKLIRRHPHVFGKSSASTNEEILTEWARIKIEVEGKKPKDSLLDSVSRAIPPLDRANKLQKKAAKVGFDWPSVDGVWSKVEEELEEAKEALQDHERQKGQQKGSNIETAEKLEGELGDLLFSVVNLCRYLKVDPSVALQKANLKFTHRLTA
ncbi:nucleoside triphosphate pyrophosphohydrolase [Treponema sp.]